MKDGCRIISCSCLTKSALLFALLGTNKVTLKSILLGLDNIKALINHAAGMHKADTQVSPNFVALYLLSRANKLDILQKA